jgi:hypothetical protein
MLERLCVNTCCKVFEFLAPADVATVRSCSRGHLAHPNWARTSRVWAAAARHARKHWGCRARHGTLIDTIANIPTATAADMCVAIYPTVFDIDLARPVLRAACASGWLAKMQWIEARFQFHESDLWDDRDSPLEVAAAHGHLEIVRQIIIEYVLDENTRYLNSHPYGRLGVIRAAVCGGHLETVQWLVGRRQTGELDGEQLLRIACTSGHLHVAQWLKDHFGVELNRIQMSTLEAVCAQGYLDGAKWLVAAFGITAGQLREQQVCEMLCRVCASEHEELAMWLVRHFESSGHVWKHRWPNTNAVADPKYMPQFVLACGSGRLGTAQWLAAEFGITAAAVRSRYCYAARRASGGGHLPIVRWLVECFDLTQPNDVTLLCNAATARGRADVATWVIEHYNATRKRASSTPR